METLHRKISISRRPIFLNQIRMAIHTRRYGYKTEVVYVQWIHFLRTCSKMVTTSARFKNCLTQNLDTTMVYAHVLNRGLTMNLDERLDLSSINGVNGSFIPMFRILQSENHWKMFIIF